MVPLTAHHWIDGEWTDARERADSINPATGETIGTYTEAGEPEAARAIAAALRTFRKTEWRLRARALNEMADRFEARSGDLVDILALENGKMRPETEFEVSMVPSKLRFYAALALTDFGRAMETSPGRYTMALRSPAGVAGIIAPWNSPVVLFIRSLAPALAAGCTAVGKLPGFTAQTNTRMCEVFSEVKRLPKGTINIFSEVGGTAARAMIASRDVPVISLTGSSKTGQAIMAAGAANMKRFGGELGGKTPVLVFDDADLDKALPRIEKALTVFAGQFCMTGSRLLVHRSILDTVREGLAARLRAVKAGPASDPSSDMGPMINRANVERVDKMVEEAIAAGARVVVREWRLLPADAARDQRSLAGDRPAGSLQTGSGHASFRHRRRSRLARQQFGIRIGRFDLVDRRRSAVAHCAPNRSGHGVGRRLRRVGRGRLQAERLGRLNGVASLDDFLEHRTIIHEVDLAVRACEAARSPDMPSRHENQRRVS
jgi:betaine-aldehyde dehydrogenase